MWVFPFFKKSSLNKTCYARNMRRVLVRYSRTIACLRICTANLCIGVSLILLLVIGGCGKANLPQDELLNKSLPTCTLAAKNLEISKGANTVLIPEIKGDVTQAFLNNIELDLSKEISVSPTETMTYTLKVLNGEGGTAECAVVVTVINTVGPSFSASISPVFSNAIGTNANLSTFTTAMSVVSMANSPYIEFMILEAQRGFDIVLTGPLYQGQTFSMDIGTTNFLFFTQNGNKQSWVSKGAPLGTLTLDTVIGKTYSFSLHNIGMRPTDYVGTDSTGTFTLNGSGQFTLP